MAHNKQVDPDCLPRQYSHGQRGPQGHWYHQTDHSFKKTATPDKNTSCLLQNIKTVICYVIQKEVFYFLKKQMLY